MNMNKYTGKPALEETCTEEPSVSKQVLRPLQAAHTTLSEVSEDLNKDHRSVYIDNDHLSVW